MSPLGAENQQIFAPSLHALRAFPEGFAGYFVQRTKRAATELITYAYGEELLGAGSSRELMQMTRAAYGNSRHVIANSENTRRAVLDIAPDVRTEVIHPGVECASLAFHADAVTRMRTEYGWPAGTPIVLTLGRMEPRKNHAGVMRAMGRLHRKGLQIGFVCAGDGPERPALVALAESEGIVPWARFPSADAEREKNVVFAAPDIFTLPSVHIGSMIEGFGIVFLEAVAAGLPVICGNSGGRPEVVQDGVTGRVIDGTDVESIAIPIQELVINHHGRAKMGEAARKLARRHEWSVVVCETLAAINKESGA